MSEFRATVAIVRRHIDRRFGVDWAMQFLLVTAVVGIFGRLFGAPIFAVVIAALLAAAAAAERAHARALRRASFFAMPLYGRQLARAHAVAPLVLATSVPLGYAAGAWLHHAPLSGELFALVTLAAFVATLIAMLSVFRDGASAWLYGLGGATCGIAVTLPALDRLAHGLAIALAGSAIAGFFALRAFGETLARYDPIGE